MSAQQFHAEVMAELEQCECSDCYMSELMKRINDLIEREQKCYLLQTAAQNLSNPPQGITLPVVIKL